MGPALTVLIVVLGTAAQPLGTDLYLAALPAIPLYRSEVTRSTDTADSLRDAHRALGSSYQQGLEAYRAAGADPAAGDNAVKGVDRATSEQMSELVNELRQRGIQQSTAISNSAERTVLRGDTAAEIPKLAASMREVLENVAALTRKDAALDTALNNVQSATERLKGPQGAMGVLMGNDEDARKLVVTVERANALLARAETLTQRMDSHEKTAWMLRSLLET